MTDHALDWLGSQPEGRTLLTAYSEREAALPKRAEPAKAAAAAVVATEPADGLGELGEDDASDVEVGGGAERIESWIPRIMSLPGVDAASLPALHGRLIALGLLKFELFGRQGGMRYRLTPLGRKAAIEDGRRADVDAADDSGSAESELVADAA
ncbi:MAG: hypothetical protein KF774_13485 [Planctomyces sp.]|nr:hypothetical protein [Planctomyces sp.]